MLYLITNCINIIIIIILLTIKIIPLKGKQHLASKHYGNFTAIEFLKELEHSKPTYDSILIMQNENATISRIFYTHLLKMLNEKNYNGTASNNSKQGFGVLSEMSTTTFIKSLMNTLQVPVLQLNELQSFYLKRQYSEHFLSIVYIDINIEGIQMTLNDHKGLLEKLSKNLLHMTTSKVMFLLNFPLVVKTDSDCIGSAAVPVDEDVIEGILVQIFHHCWQQKFINVVALLADYQITKKFYSYNHFPEFQLEVKTIASNLKDQESIYPYRLGNLKGYKLSINTGSKIPRIIRYNTTKGKEIIGGFVGHFITAFAKKYKCTLVEPLQFKPEQFFSEKDLRDAVKNGTVEVSLGVTPRVETLLSLTYPIVIINWCIMLPVEPNIPSYKFFTSVFKGESYFVVVAVIIVLSMVLSAALYIHGHHVDFFDIFCHDNCLRGVISQSFSEITNPPMIIRFIYLQICILGILLTTSYLSYFSTYVTSPPREAFLNSFDDMLRSGLKIVMWEYEHKRMMDIPGYKKYDSVFHVVGNFQEVENLRDTFNTKYGYGVSNLQWAIVKEQQKIFTTPLFRQSSNFCIIYNIPIGFPIQENSIFYSLINQLILETAQSGLLYQWIDLGFFELIAAKMLKLEDLSARNEFQAMTIDDLRYVLIFLGGMLLFVNLVFLGELLVFYRQSICNFLINCILTLKHVDSKKIFSCSKNILNTTKNKTEKKITSLK